MDVLGVADLTYIGKTLRTMVRRVASFATASFWLSRERASISPRDKVENFCYSWSRLVYQIVVILMPSIVNDFLGKSIIEQRAVNDVNSKVALR